MRFASRNALGRIAALLVVGAGALWYMCDRPQPGKQTMTPPTIAVDNLRAHVWKLCGEFGEHNVANPAALRKAENYIAQVWRDQGYTVTRQPYQVGKVECANLEVTHPGNREIVVIGAHYDSVFGCPGANDNGSGVAALLEISRVFAQTPPHPDLLPQTTGEKGSQSFPSPLAKGEGQGEGSTAFTTEARRTIRFVAFVNEEPPYFQTALQGSRVYARAARERGDDIRAMLALETLGYYSDDPGSQRFPSVLFKLLYPGRGNFVAFISNFQSRGVMRAAVRAFRGHSDFPVECCATYAGIAGIGWSDHAAFWHEGYRAFMVTDTAPFRYPHYHQPSDTPDKVNYPALARVTSGLCGTVAALAATK